MILRFIWRWLVVFILTITFFLGTVPPPVMAQGLTISNPMLSKIPSSDALLDWFKQKKEGIKEKVVKKEEITAKQSDLASDTFTLQLLHASDIESGLQALEDFPRFSAVLNALKDDYPNTIVLSSGDNYILSPFLFKELRKYLIKVKSPYSADETADRFEQAVRDSGSKVFPRIDHQEAAAEFGLEMGENMVISFGNPRYGTRFMAEQNPEAGIDFPPKVQVYEEKGEVFLALNTPLYLYDVVFKRHGLEFDEGDLTFYEGVINNLLEASIGKTVNFPQVPLGDTDPGVREEDRYLIRTRSKFSAEETADRFEDAVLEKGLKVFPRFDHQQAAEEYGLELDDNIVLMFGNPRYGTPFMVEQNPQAGIDFPPKAQVYGKDGKVWLAVNSSQYLYEVIFERHGLKFNEGDLVFFENVVNDLIVDTLDVDQLLRGGEDNDVLLGYTGNDILLGGRGDDQLYGGKDDDDLDGGRGNDQLWGNSGDDMLLGREGNDILLGGKGKDELNGGVGNDELTGGQGADTFILAAGEGTDTITDFGNGSDLIGLLRGIGFSDLSFSGEDIILTSTNEILATLTGVDTTTLTASDFITI
ncbi:MAG: DUF302 domain-containing protein [Crocosphaera sp.]|nr:DUF302 domain-containing protein [Crocosphaera sp.]